MVLPSYVEPFLMGAVRLGMSGLTGPALALPMLMKLYLASIARRWKTCKRMIRRHYHIPPLTWSWPRGTKFGAPQQSYHLRTAIHN